MKKRKKAKRKRSIGDLSFVSGKVAVSMLRRFENAKKAIRGDMAE